MGIKGLKQFLRSKFPQCVKESHLYYYWGQKAAMDLLPYLYRYKVSHGDKWREGLFTLLTTFIKHNVHLTVIMDGPMVYKEKDKERAKRQQNRDRIKTKLEQLQDDLRVYDEKGTITDLLRSVSDETSHRHLLLSVSGSGSRPLNRDAVVDCINKLKNQIVSITSDDIRLVRELCDGLSLPFLYARQEAESFSSYLCRNHQVDVVITEDTDVLAYGCPHWLSNIAHDGTCIYIGFDYMLNEMNFSREQFIDFCILCGTDYNETIRGLGPVSAYKLLSMHKTIEKSVDDTKELNQVVLRDIFINPCSDAIPQPDTLIPYKPTIYFNPLPEEERITFSFGASFKAWLRKYDGKFTLI